MTLITNQSTRLKKQDAPLHPLEALPIQEEIPPIPTSQWDEGPVFLEQQITTARMLAKVGFADGINPMDPAGKWLANTLNLTPAYQESPPYQDGHQQGIRQKEYLLQTGHILLDLGGMIPVIGEPLDMANGGLYVLQGDYANAGLCLGAIIPLGGVFATGGRLAKKVDTEALTRGTIAEILEQTTVQAGKVAKGIKEQAIKVNVLGSQMYNRVLKKFGIDPAVEKVSALAYKNHIYVERDSAFVLRDIVHEGTHALDHLEKFRGTVHQWERRAFYFDQQFQKWVDGPLDFDDMNDMMETIYKLY